MIGARDGEHEMEDSKMGDFDVDLHSYKVKRYEKQERRLKIDS